MNCQHTRTCVMVTNKRLPKIQKEMTLMITLTDNGSQMIYKTYNDTVALVSKATTVLKFCGGL